MTNRRDLSTHELKPWYRGPMTGLDLETTSVDPETARICGAAVVTVQCPGANAVNGWIVDPEVQIQPDATEVHGMTDDYVREHGVRRSVAVPMIVERLRWSWSLRIPVVIFNAPFDLTVLDRELRRVHGPGLDEIGPVIDPFVLDKLADPFRRGSRKLAAVASHYQAADLSPSRVHGAEEDALAALKTAWKIGYRYPALGSMKLGKLQRLQAEAKARQAASLDRYFASIDHPEAGKVRSEWPIFPYGEAPRELEDRSDAICSQCGAPMVEHTSVGCPEYALTVPD